MREGPELNRTDCIVNQIFNIYRKNILEIHLDTVKMEKYNEIRYTKS